ncbi:MAG: tRNA-dihydrouridine synthase, partial [Flavobacteriales bacterium]
GNPWFFKQVKHYVKTGEKLPSPSIKERVEVAKTHLQKSIDWKGEKKGVLEMRRHYGKYFKGIPDFKPWRNSLVTIE